MECNLFFGRQTREAPKKVRKTCGQPIGQKKPLSILYFGEGLAKRLRP